MHIADLLWMLLKLYAAVIILLSGIAVALAISKVVTAVRQRITTPPEPIESTCSRSLSN